MGNRINVESRDIGIFNVMLAKIKEGNKMKKLKLIIYISEIIGWFILLSGFLLKYSDDYSFMKKFISKDYYFIEKEYKKCLDNENYFLTGKKANRFLLIIKPLEEKYNRRIPINHVNKLRVEHHIGPMTINITSGKGVQQSKYRLRIILDTYQTYEIRMDAFMNDVREMLNYDKIRRCRDKQLFSIGSVLFLVGYILNILIILLYDKSKKRTLNKQAKSNKNNV